MPAASPVRVPPVALILIAAFAAAAGLWLGGRWLRAPAPPALASAVLYPAPRELPEFHLTTSDGRPLDRAAWRGRWTLVYFGYASCPDVCPTTLATFKQVWQELARRHLDDRVRFDFVSVDPERDTPERLASYVAFFDRDFVAATGSDAELTHLTRALGLIYARRSDANGAVTVDHSGSVVIIDPQARLVGLFRPPFAAAAIAADLATLVDRPG
jgi:protein SCO1/2